VPVHLHSRHFETNIPMQMSALNPLKPNNPCMGRTAPLTSKRCILYIYSTNIGIEYFKHGIYSTLFPLQNAVCFIIITYLVPVLFTFYIQGVLKLKNNSGTKRLTATVEHEFSIISWRNLKRRMIMNEISDGSLLTF